MMTYALAALAAYRLAQMLALEDGPFDAFTNWRAFIGTDKQATWLQRGFACPDCISFWTAAFAAALTRPAGLVEFVLAWLGVAGAALLLNRLTARMTR